MLWTKRAHHVQFFILLSALIKFHLILQAIFETTIIIVTMSCIQCHVFCITVKSHEKQLDFQTFEWLGENLPNSSCHI